jgi:hypothetical protein
VCVCVCTPCDGSEGRHVSISLLVCTGTHTEAAKESEGGEGGRRHLKTLVRAYECASEDSASVSKGESLAEA